MRASYAVKSSSSAGVGRVSGVSQRPSRASMPWDSSYQRQNCCASRTRRGRSSRPTRFSKTCSLGPPSMRRRAMISVSCGALGRLRVASSVTTDTQPSMRASRPSRRCTASSWSSVRWGLNMPPSNASCTASGLLMSTWDAASCMRFMSTRMPRA